MRGAYSFAQAVRECRGFGHLQFAAHQNNGELVASQSGDGVAFTYALARPASHFFQKLVADRMTESVVDLLEAIEVEAKHGDLLTARDATEGTLQPLTEQRTVRQIGQRVVARHMRNL